MRVNLFIAALILLFHNYLLFISLKLIIKKAKYLLKVNSDTEHFSVLYTNF